MCIGCAHSIRICAFTHDAYPNAHSQNHLRRWFRCALAFDPVSWVDHMDNYSRGCVMLKCGTAGANSTQLIGLVKRSLLLSCSCFRRSRAQLNNKGTASTASVNIGHFVTWSSCITISTYDVHCPWILKTSVNMIDALPIRFHLMHNLMRIKCEHALILANDQI